MAVLSLSNEGNGEIVVDLVADNERDVIAMIRIKVPLGGRKRHRNSLIHCQCQSGI